MKWASPLNYDADVFIAGAGPAGAACAYHLCKSGLKVILADYQGFPRDKVCGDFVGPVAIKECERMGISGHADFQQTNIITQAAVFLDGKKLLTKSIPEVDDLPSYGRVIPRQIFDNWLLQAAIQAGARFIPLCRLNDFTVYDNAVVCNCTQSKKQVNYTTKLIIGADGSSSTCARLLSGKKPDGENRIVAVRAYYKNISCTPQQAELYFSSKSFPGYYWFFPTAKNEANVGIGMVLENFPKEDISLKDLLNELVQNDDCLKERIGKDSVADKVVGWPLSTYNPKAQITNDRVVLIGDAAGLINSLNGEGIQYAMLSGRWAAETIVGLAKSNDFSANALMAYDKKIKDELGYDMSLSNLVIQFIRNRNLNDFWLKLLQIMAETAEHDQAYADTAGGILAGLMPSNKAVNISFVGKTVLQAFSTTVRDTGNAVLNGPSALTAFAFDKARFAMKNFVGAIDQRSDYMHWIRGIAEQSIHLSGHVVKHAVKKLKIEN
ncbi:NAD(P)/FAD-dependent oxidoreductase [Pinibacter aurantiacus]|uniref:NAD(P)/FAD-dependent oxidoreductase n=1 Tax=Pinibacter aurantiacus TaxID=2851599 RepID=A0A9E2W5A1_9BACT|nr:NAD(P)/FAD-dependent oxidoreductase [Pinibacter aurantiacus]MBV4360645.1 NAD(P)/FAD-dependent oxidoreductase [Pinibacter aurantiacus]